MKQPRKKRRKHTFPHNAPEPRSAAITPEYQAEVDRSMDRGRQRWEHTQAELAKAERRRARTAAKKPRTAKQTKHQKRLLAELDELIELHRMRLRDLSALMTQSPQSSVHRGTRSYRPVPEQGELL